MTAQQAFGRAVLSMTRTDEGHRVGVGDWSTANHLRTAWAAHPDASQHDVKWTLKPVQPHLIQLVQDLWDSRCAILTGVPVPSSRPRLRRQRFFAVAEVVHKGINEFYVEVQLQRGEALAFPTHHEAQTSIDAYKPHATISLGDCAAPHLIIFADGSYTPSGAQPTTAGWVFVLLTNHSSLL